MTGHTAKGYVNFISSNIKDISKVIILNHPSNVLKTKVLRQLLNHFTSEYEVEMILSANGRDYLEGILITKASLAIITDSIAEKAGEARIFDLTEVLPASENHELLTQAILEDFKESYHFLAKALAIHDRLESVYIAEMDFKKADQVAENFIQRTLGEIPPKKKESVKKHRLFGTNTHEGAINVIPDLLRRVQSRFFLKGRAGTGKSTFLRSVINECENLGLNMEIYHCSFDPDSIDMLLVPEADFCIFDSTGPHEFFPEAKQDVIIDLYEETVTPGTDEKYATEIQNLTKDYKREIKKALKKIRYAREKQLEIEKKYSITDFKVKNIVKQILANL